MRLSLTLAAGLALLTAAHAQVPSYVPTNGLVGWWPFTGNANDESGNGNDGTVSGAMLTMDRFGSVNSAFDFSATGSLIQTLISNNQSPSSSKDYTMSFWFSMDNPLVSDALLVTYKNGQTINGPNTSNYDIVHSHSACFTSDNIAVQNYPFSNPAGCSPTSISYNQWYYLIVHYKTSQLSFDVLINGAMWFSGNLGTTIPSAGILTFGNNDVGNFPSQGKLDDIGIWNRALDPCEIQALYNSGSQGISPSPVAYSGLNSSYTLADAPSQLSGTPAGGVFIGPGVSGNTFDPASAGVGQHSIIYSYVDECGSVNSAGLCTEVTLNVGVGGSHMSTSNVHVYPNPNRGQFTVEMDLQGLASLQVFDAAGRLVHNEVFQANGSKTIRNLDLSSLSKGSYAVQVQNNGGTISQSVVIE